MNLEQMLAPSPHRCLAHRRRADRELPGEFGNIEPRLHADRASHDRRLLLRVHTLGGCSIHH
jgi:hypothetical protein